MNKKWKVEARSLRVIKALREIESRLGELTFKFSCYCDEEFTYIAKALDVRYTLNLRITEHEIDMLSEDTVGEWLDVLIHHPDAITSVELNVGIVSYESIKDYVSSSANVQITE